MRPRKKNPPDQWAYVQQLASAGRARAAARQALALRIFYPLSPEAPQAQLFYARWLDQRGALQAAFEAYQHLMDHYAGQFEFNAVLDRQMALAKKLMETKRGKFLFLPGFSAPERAIPLFEKILANAPEGRHAAEAHYLSGLAHQRTYEYDKAIDSYFQAMTRFPQSEFAEPAALGQAQCHIRKSREAPNDTRALATAYAGCVLFLQRFPQSPHRAEIEAEMKRLRQRQIQHAYALARYYDRILRKPTAAMQEYRTFLALFPEAEQAPAVRQRLAELEQMPPSWRRSP